MAITERVPAQQTSPQRLKGVGVKLAELALMASVIPVLHPSNTMRVVEFALGNAPGCEQLSEQERQYPFNVIAVPGAGSKKIEKGVYEPNMHGEFRLAAAAILYAQGYAPRIVLLDGVGSKGISDGNKKYLQKVYQTYTGSNREIPKSAIKVENSSVNTATNVRELKKRMEFYERALVVTDTSHVMRARHLAQAFGINSRGICAEEVVVDAFPGEAKNAAKLQGEGIREKVEVFLTLEDPHGSIPTITRRLEKLVR